MGVYGIALAGWASNNKYSLLGGLRSSAQMISYELPMSIAIASPLLMLGTLSLREIVQAQDGYYFGFLPHWNIFQGPFPQIFSFFVFLIAGVRRNQPRAFRSAGSRERTGRRISTPNTAA